MSKRPLPPASKTTDLPNKRPPSPANMVSRTPRAPGAKPAQEDEEHLQLPHERDQNSQMTDPKPRRVMVQAAKDIENGLVDTDMRATPGLDAEQRARDVPGSNGPPTTKDDKSGPSDAPASWNHRSADPVGQGRKPDR